MSALSDRPENPSVGLAIPHESAALHVTGAALYTDDLVYRTKHVLHAYPVQVPHAHARITALRTEPALAVPGRRAGADRGRRPRRQRRRRQARRAAVPDRGHVPRPRGVLGARRDHRGGPARRRGGRGRGRAAAGLRDGARGDRGRELPGRAAAAGAAATSRPASPGSTHVFSGEFEFSGQEHFYLETHARAGPRRRERADLRPEQHPAPVRDAGDRRARARPAQPRGDRAVPAHGRRLRRQGDAAARVRGHRRARRRPHRAPGPAAAQPHPGPDDVGQAARLPRAVAGRLRRRRAGCRPSTRR